MHKIFLLIVLLLLGVVSLSAQNQVHFLRVSGSQNSDFIKQAKRLRRLRFDDEKTLHLKLENFKSRFIEKGYLETSIDSSFRLQDTVYAVFHIGKPYIWKELDLKINSEVSVPQFDFSFTGAHDKGFTEGIEQQSEILDYYLNQAYPFASIALSNLEIINGEINGTCLLNPNQHVVWDTMLIKGESGIHPKFIQNHLGIKPGQAYSEKKFESIAELISKLDFISEIKASELEFFDGKARVHNYLRKQSANRFDGILGFQTNNKTDKLELTGDVNLLLVNSFHRGERIQFNWRKLEESSQNLNLCFQYPYIFNSKLGVDFSFELLKQDSTYLNTNLRLGLNLKQSVNSDIKLFYQLKSSNLLSSKQFAGLSVLPDYADSKSNLLGFQYQYENLNRRFNPQKGWELKFEVAAGENKIEQNLNITEELYKGIELKTNTFEGLLSLKNYIPVRSKWVYHWQVQGGWLERKNYFENDLFRLGGMKSIRGFNEDAFRASKYAILKQEFRFVPDRNTSIYLFIDMAWYKQEVQDTNYSDKPMGYGFGLNFSAGSGLFTLNYALGKQDGESSDLKSAKIHFGFIASF